MAEQLSDPAGWSLALDEDIDLPGWVLLPHGLDADEQEAWLDVVTTHMVALIEDEAADLGSSSRAAVRGVFERGLHDRAGSRCAAMFLVWPIAAPTALTCEVNYFDTAELPDLSTLGGRLHDTEARHLGAGRQISTRRVITGGDEDVEVSAVHLIFHDDETGVMISLQENASLLMSQALVGLGIFTDALVMTRTDGTRFTATMSRDADQSPVWPVLEDQTR